MSQIIIFWIHYVKILFPSEDHNAGKAREEHDQQDGECT